MAEVMIDEKRAKEVIFELLNACQKNWFKLDILPQHKYFPNKLVKGSNGHALWLWFVALLMRGKLNSDTIFSRVHDNFDINFFTPQDIPDIADQTLLYFLQKIIQKYHLIEFVKAWQKNAEQLEYFGWSPIELFANVKTFDDALNILLNNGFVGWREKIISLLCLWYEEAKIIQPIYGPPPVDFHALRIFAATGVLIIPAGSVGYKKGVDAVYEFLKKFCPKEKILAQDISAMLWLLSRKCCKKQTCHLCPVEKFCAYFIPSSAYYGGTRQNEHIKGGKITVLPRVEKQIFLL